MGFYVGKKTFWNYSNSTFEYFDIKRILTNLYPHPFSCKFLSAVSGDALVCHSSVWILGIIKLEVIIYISVPWTQHWSHSNGWVSPSLSPARQYSETVINCVSPAIKQSLWCSPSRLSLTELTSCWGRETSIKHWILTAKLSGGQIKYFRSSQLQLPDCQRTVGRTVW